MKETQKIYEAIGLISEIEMNFNATRAKILLRIALEIMLGNIREMQMTDL